MANQINAEQKAIAKNILQLLNVRGKDSIVVLEEVDMKIRDTIENMLPVIKKAFPSSVWLCLTKKNKDSWIFTIDRVMAAMNWHIREYRSKRIKNVATQTLYRFLTDHN